LDDMLQEPPAKAGLGKGSRVDENRRRP